MLLLPIAYSQNVPADDSGLTQTMIQEHKNTRKFVSDEITRQRTQFNKDFEDRAEYYKNEADSLINQAVWKLGLMWGGIVLLVFGMSNFLNRRLEKRKWNKMLESAKAEIMAEVNQKKEKIDAQHKERENQLVQGHQAIVQKNAQLNQKAEQIKKARPQLQAMQKKMAQQQEELKKVMNNLQLFEDKEMTPPPTDLPPPPPPPSMRTGAK
jgi:multidrug efflux pump subunit AcrB